MKKILLAIFLTTTLIFPELSFADLVSCDGANCQWDDLIGVSANFIKFLLTLLLPVVAILFVYSGGMLIYYGINGNTDGYTKVRGYFVKLFFGVLIMLSAWLLVDTALKFLGVDEEIVNTVLNRGS